MRKELDNGHRLLICHWKNHWKLGRTNCVYCSGYNAPTLCHVFGIVTFIKETIYKNIACSIWTCYLVQ